MDMRHETFSILGDAAVNDDHVMIGLGQFADDRPTNEPNSTEDDEAHRFQV